MNASGHLGRLSRILLAGAVALAFVSPATAQGRIEENSLVAVSYTGTWYPSLNLNHSGGSAILSTEAGATAAVTFDGTGIRWIGYRDEWSGIAGVYLDGAFVTTVDTYASPAQHQAVLFSLQGLPAGSHRLVLQALQTHSGASGGAWIWIDAFDVTVGDPTTVMPPSWDGATRYEQDSPVVSYTGTWFSNTYSAHSGGVAALSLESGARATFSFSGTGIRWIGYRDEWSGIARVYLDGALVGFVDTYASPSQAQAVLFTTNGLTSGPHTVAVEATHERNVDSKGRWVWVDAFDVLP